MRMLCLTVLLLLCTPGCSTITPDLGKQLLLERNWELTLKAAGKPLLGAAWVSTKQSTEEAAGNGAVAGPANPTPAPEPDASSSSPAGVVLTEEDMQ